MGLGLRADMPLHNFQAFVEQVTASLPSCQFVYLAAPTTPFVRSRGQDFGKRLEAMNAKVRDFAAASDGVIEFVPNGAFQSDEVFFLGDGHHLNHQGKQKLALLLAPAVQAQLKRAHRLGLSNLLSTPTPSSKN